MSEQNGDVPVKMTMDILLSEEPMIIERQRLELHRAAGTLVIGLNVIPDQAATLHVNLVGFNVGTSPEEVVTILESVLESLKEGLVIEEGRYQNLADAREMMDKPFPATQPPGKPAGYGRYKDDPEHIGCPRAKSDMTPCIARDGASALADNQNCVGCNEPPQGIDGLLQELRHALTGKSPAPVTNPRHAADKLREEVRAATAP